MNESLSNMLETSSAQAIWAQLAAPLPRNGDAWEARMEAMARSLLEALCELRDAGALEEFSLETLREHLPLGRIEALSEDPRLSEAVRGKLRSYLEDLPGWQPGQMTSDDPGVQRSRGEAMEQHGYLSMQIASLLAVARDEDMH